MHLRAVREVELKKVFVILMTMLLGTAAHAVELFEYHKPVRAYGMGGVFIPFATDADAVLWNPAQLANVETMSWKMVDIGLGANGTDVMSAYQDMQDSGCAGSACYSEFYGRPIYVSYQGQTSFAMPYWGVSAYMFGTVSGTLHNPAFPSFNLNYFNDTGFNGAVGLPLGPGLSVGAAFKRIHRLGGNQDVSISTLMSGGGSLLDQFTQNGVGYGLDLAMMFSTPTTSVWKTTAVLAWQDVGSMAFLPNGDSESPPRIKDNLSFGLGMAMDLPGLDFKAGMEYRHITLQGEQLGKKLHLGGEVGLPMLDIQFGLNQGYPTIGTGIDLLFMRLDLASYTEEVGYYPGQTPSQRFRASLSIDLAVDANFQFTSKDGRKRRLKQRR